jgi:hypothetical protein
MTKNKIRIVSLEDKKDDQILQDIQRTPQERWLYMWHLIEIAIAFSPTHTLKFFDDQDRFVTLKRKNATA